MTDLKPWLEVAEPRRDIADGSFDESLFAADLGLVDRDRGPADYLDPVTFCEKTYLTENLLAFLRELTARLSGDMAAAGVYRLQTEFGGGKTHTLLAAYHLFRDPARVAGTAFVSELAAKLGRSSFPQAKVVVLEGGALGAGEIDSQIQDAQVRTLLGQLAYRLGGPSGFAKVEEQDRNLRGSSTTQIAELLEANAPCLILLDELLQYLTKALAVPTHDGNLAATTLTFIKELCTAAASVPRVAVVATLTSSNLEDYASVAGEEMQERLSKVVGRTENIVTPVEGDDIFPILHRRLVHHHRVQMSTGARSLMPTPTGTSHSSDAVPASYREASYRDRLATAFPFPSRAGRHPHQPLGVAVGFPADPGCVAHACPHGQGSVPAAEQSPAHPSRRRHAQRSGHPRGGPSVRRRELQGCPERRHHPSRLDGPGRGPAPGRRGRELRLGHGAGHDRILELVRLRPCPRRVSRADADRGRPARAVTRASRGRA